MTSSPLRQVFTTLKFKATIQFMGKCVGSNDFQNGVESNFNQLLVHIRNILYSISNVPPSQTYPIFCH